MKPAFVVLTRRSAMAGPVKREPCRAAVVRVSVEETTDRKPRESPLAVLFYAAIGTVVFIRRASRRLSAVRVPR